MKSNSKRLWKRKKAHFAERARYHGPKKSYFFEASPGNFVPLSETALVQELTVRGFGYTPKTSLSTKLKKHSPKSQTPKNIRQQQKDEFSGELKEFLSEVRENRRVDWVGELAGYFPGPTNINNTPCLILRGPSHLEPRKGDYQPIYKIIHSLLGQTPEQEDYFLAAFHRAIRLSREGRYEPTQVFFFAGNPDDGKTLLVTEIISAALGGRRIDATSYFIGATRFNFDLARCELWIVDDQGDAKGFDRLVYANNLKKTAADPDVRVEPKGVDAINARHLFHVVAVLFNLEGRGGSHLVPEISEDNKGKFLIFRTSRADLPGGPDQYREIQEHIRRALPAYLYWALYEHKVNPAVLSGDRFQIKPYHDPDVLLRIQETGNAAHLLALIDQWMKETKQDKWFGQCIILYHALLNSSAGTAKIIGSMFKSVNGFGRVLSELSHRYPERVFKNENKRGTVYRILSPAKAEELEEAAEVTTPQKIVIDAKFEP